jgi:pyruvate kinase
METKKTKIICTISDMNCEVEFIRKLYKNGMNVARINSAHATIEGAQKIVDNVRAVSDRIAILVDTKGPEVRLTAMEGPVGFVVKEGDIVDIRRGTQCLCGPKVLYTNCESFMKVKAIMAKKNMIRETTVGGGHIMYFSASNAIDEATRYYERTVVYDLYR